MTRRQVFWVVLVAGNLLGVSTAYAISVWIRHEPIMRTLNDPARRTQSPGLFRSDPVLGYAPMANQSGAFLFPRGLTVPIHFDAGGFRVPDRPAADGGSRPVMLALGCSYTFGDAVAAEDTFVEQLAARLGGLAPKNAGVSGYGLAQMTLLAERLIPDLRPAMVLVQYSPWLVDRAISGTAPSAFGDIPTPHFVTRDGRTSLEPPAFETALFRLPFFRYGERVAGAPPSALSFYTEVALPYAAWTDAHRVSTWLRRWRSSGDEASRLAAVQTAYQRIAAAARGVGARLVVVALAGGPTPVSADVLEILNGIPAATVVDAEPFLARALGTPAPVTASDYHRAYAVWAGSPPVQIDPHPNVRANQLIAEALAGALPTPSQARP